MHRKNWLCLILVLLLAITNVPVTSYATGNEGTEDKLNQNGNEDGGETLNPNGENGKYVGDQGAAGEGTLGDLQGNMAENDEGINNAGDDISSGLPGKGETTARPDELSGDGIAEGTRGNPSGDDMDTGTAGSDVSDDTLKQGENGRTENLIEISAEEISAQGEEIALADADMLYEQYFNRIMYPAASSSIKKAPRVGRLNEQQAALYHGLKTFVQAVANGEQAETVFTPENSVSLTAEEIGVTTVISGGTFTNEAREAIRNWMKEQYVSPVMQALMADVPYELYWFDKTWGWSYGYGLSYDGSSVTVQNIRLSMAVSADYTASGEENTFLADTTLTGATVAAANRAGDIVDYAGNKDWSDYEILKYYLEKICDLAEYNIMAAYSGDVSYGDPWQMVYVFDGNPATTVVCEGYSKAFKYLCDCTSFASRDIEAYLVSGDMNIALNGEGPHMWNVVRMDDKAYYLVDATNCDQRELTYDLFLKGCQTKTTGATGYPAYSYKINASTLFYMFDAETVALYTEAELSLSSTDYNPGGGNIDTSEYVNILDFGAVPDDEKDDVGAFNDAIWMIAAGETESRTIKVPAGIYDIDCTHNDDGIGIDFGMVTRLKPLMDGDNITLELDEGAVLRAMQNNRNAYKIIYVAYNSNIVIKGGKIEGERNLHGGTTGEAGMGIDAWAVSGLTIDDIEITNCWGDGIQLSAGYDDESKSVLPCTDVIIQNCTISNNRRDNISIVGASRVTIDNCEIKEAHGTPNQCGILIEPYIEEHVNAYPVCTDITISNTEIWPYNGNKPVTNNKTTDDRSRQHLTLATYLIMNDTRTQLNRANPSGWAGYSSDNIKLINCTLHGDMANYSGRNVSLVDCTVEGKIEYDGSGPLTVLNTVHNGLTDYSYQNLYKHVTVTFQSAGKTFAQSVLQSGKSVPRPLKDPEREGYTFYGWYLDGSEYKFSQAVRKNITLKADWGEQEPSAFTCEVTFDANGGVISDAESGGKVSRTTKEVTYEVAYGELPEAEQEGYLFDGWYTEADGGSPVTEATKVTDKQNHTLYAHWSPYHYPVYYVLNGGHFAERTTHTDKVDHGQTLARPEDPERAGHVFLGWYTAPASDPAAALYRFEEEPEGVTGTLTLYAHWSAQLTVEAPEIRIYSDKAGDPNDEKINHSVVNNETQTGDIRQVHTGARIKLSSGTPDAQIYYRLYATTDEAYADVSKFDDFLAPLSVDADVLTDCIRYTEEIVLSPDTVFEQTGKDYKGLTIWAIAVKPGYTNSGYSATTVHVYDEDQTKEGTPDWGDVTETDQAGYENPSEIPKGIWIAGVEDRAYTGKVLTFPDLRVYHNKRLLKLKTDYTLSYKNNKNLYSLKKGEDGFNESKAPTVIITGKGNYTGTFTKTFAIMEDVPATQKTTDNINGGNVEDASKTDKLPPCAITGTAVQVYYLDRDGNIISGDDYKYEKNGVKPLLQLTYTYKDGTGTEKEYTLQQGVDYTLRWTNNTAPRLSTAKNPPTITIKGKGTFSGTRKETFSINKQSIDACTITAPDFIYTGKANKFKSTPIVRDVNGAALKAGTDYDTSKTAYYYAEDTTLANMQIRPAGTLIDKADIVPVGTLIRVVVAGKGNYTGTASGTYRMVSADLSKASVKIEPQYYTGSAIRLSKRDIVVTLSGKVLSDSDYEIVSYKNNINKGKASATLRGVGLYGREKTVKFTIAARPISCIIRYDGNRATSGSVKQQTANPGSSVTLRKNAFKRKYYEFTGWNTEPVVTADRMGTPYDNQAVLTVAEDASGSVLTLYAQWEPITYTITWHLQGGTNHPDNVRTTYTAEDNTFAILAPLQKDWPDGFQFAGWYTDVNYKNKITQVRKGSGGDLHLYAKWMPYTYTLKFDGNGATSGTMNDQTLSYGVAASLSANKFKKTGYVFAGWYRYPIVNCLPKDIHTDKESVTNLITPRSSYGETVTLYAVWRNRFDIKYELNYSGSDSALEEMKRKDPYYKDQYTYGRTVALPDPERDGYTFVGWYKDAALKTRMKQIEKTTSGDLTLYAKWKQTGDEDLYGKTYMVRFHNALSEYAADATKISGTMKNQKIRYEKAATLTANSFKHTGGRSWAFAGWATSAEEAKNGHVSYTNKEKLQYYYPEEELQEENGTYYLDLYAVWQPKYTVKYNNNIKNVPADMKATGKMSNQTLVYGSEGTLRKNGFAIKGYIFCGWSLEPKPVADSREEAEALALVQYNNAQRVKMSNESDPAVPFADNDPNAIQASKGITLYAVWAKAHYTITYLNVPAGVTHGYPDTYTIDDTVTLGTSENDPEDLGNVFLGWYSDAKYKKRVTQIKKGSTGNRTLYARWRSDVYVINYVLNGGTLDTEAPGYINSISRSDTASYQLPVPEREGYVFAGWYSDAKFKTRVYEISARTGTSVTLYAKWTVMDKKDIANAQITIAKQKYTGSPVTLSKNDVLVYFGDELLDEDFYEIVETSYLYNVEESNASGNDYTRARITICGTGAYTGTQMVYFDIDENAVEYLVAYDNNRASLSQYGSLAGASYFKGTMPESKVADGAKIHKNKFSATYFTFTGWNTKADGTGRTYQNSEVLSGLKDENNLPVESLTLYAQWKANFTFNELTNQPVTNTAFANQRPIAVMIDNEQVALPHYGMGEADIVYEMMNSTLNSRVTRYMAIYKDWKNIARIGNVRSTRPTNALIFPEYGAVLFHEGAPYVHTNAYFNNGYTPHVDGGFSRIANGKAYEYTSFLTAGQAQSRMQSAGISVNYSNFPNGGQKKEHFRFTTYGTAVSLSGKYQNVKNGTTADLSTAFPKNYPKLIYNASKGVYEYSEYGSIHTDAEDGQVLAFKNVILQKAPYTVLDGNGYLIYNISGVVNGWETSTDGWYLVNGKAVPIRWRKTTATDYTRYYALNEEGWYEEITVDTGKTYIALVPDDYWEKVRVN